jgi:hypothetical protein
LVLQNSSLLLMPGMHEPSLLPFKGQKAPLLLELLGAKLLQFWLSQALGLGTQPFEHSARAGVRRNRGENMSI